MRGIDFKLHQSTVNTNIGPVNLLSKGINEGKPYTQMWGLTSAGTGCRRQQRRVPRPWRTLLKAEADGGYPVPSALKRGYE